MNDLHSLTVTDAAGLIARKDISSVELTRACLDRIGERNAAIGAWCHLDETLSLAQAEKADRTPARTPLHGIPFGIKDVIDTADLPTESGAHARAGRRPSVDALCVTRLRDAGAVVLGKLVTTEYAMFTPRETRNPFNLAHTPGGSSSGTAAAVADRQVPFGIGTQTAGSLIRPAAFCGVYGLKPSHGLVPCTGVQPLQPLFDTLGYMARSLEDLCTVLGVLSGNDRAEPWKRDRGTKIGLCRTAHWDRAQSCSRFVLEETARQLAARGVEIVEFDLPDGYSDLVSVHRALLARGAAESLASDHGSSRGSMSPGAIAIIEEGLALPEDVCARYGRRVEECRIEIDALLGDVDALICPSAPGEAPAGMATGDPVFQVVWTLLGVPALNLPIATGPRGLPLGVQLIGRRNDDARLLAIGRSLMERLTRIDLASPPVPMS